MARCLITGHKGYIGTHLFETLQSLGHEVVGIDLQLYNKDVIRELEEATDGSFHPYYTDFQPDYLFHLACFPRVAYSVEQPVETMLNNVMATSVALNFARKIGVKRFVYSSSSSVVGNGDGPTSPYALQKYTSELEVKLYSELYGLDTVSLRYFNVYSKDQKAESAYATAVANYMKHIREGKTPFITGDGEQRRDMAHVSDVVSANIFAMEYDGRFDGAHFDVGTGDNISMNEIKDIVHLYHSDVEFDYIEERKGDVLVTLADMTPLAELGWTPQVPIIYGVDECFLDTKRNK
jgi:UDP-glucose 4-epimerase